MSRKNEHDILSTLEQIWCEVLHLDKVAAHDRFDDLGGNSLSKMRLSLKIFSKFQRRISLKELNNFATLDDQAALIGRLLDE